MLLCQVDIADPATDPSADLLNAGYRKRLAYDVSRGYYVITFASPPCCSWSAVRHVPMKGSRGPKPLRSRTHPWYPCRDNFSRSELKTFHVGTYPMLVPLWVLTLQSQAGGWCGFEHPDDRGYGRYCSISATELFQTFLRTFQWQICVIYQCMYGFISKKRTLVVVSDKPLACLRQQCNHGVKHRPLAGARAGGGFATTNTGEYPPLLSRDIARAATTALVQRDGVRSRSAARRGAVGFRLLWPSESIRLFDDYCSG